ncbi:transcriptional regulator with XRE-family HTH domain [Novosphingobium sp. 1748]|uniref:helix-turn-helix domain-containing protein n=1 Tax=Novosphingobium sp. 1748 TaxID=2817760 RepID=UPI00285FCBE5|nr:helix-turn-helix domain-containing protein [Novosphingobium sp. 1748]MDR6709297.1 transcriptional regulator with XRE-family HTH domain [Novosphingobium sp. 1748]
MTLQSQQATDGEIFELIKELSGKLIERRRRRERVSQHSLAKTVGRSERWLREIEGGVATSKFEDHVRCAHALRMTTPHLFVPLLAMEHKMAVPRELLMQDDLWDLERDMLDAVERHQASALARLATRPAQAGLRDR